MIKKILKTIVYIFLALLVIVNMTILVMKIAGQQPNILGYHIYYIASGSMEPTINVGEVIVGKETDVSEFKENDIVTFYGTKGALSGKIITHRIIKIYEEDGERTLMETIDQKNISDPETLLIGKEEMTRIEGKINEVLSPFELEVLYSYLQGISYQEIARIWNKDIKSVDNALQRIKKKVEKFLNDNKYKQ